MLIINMPMPRHCNECACFYGGVCFAIKDPNIDGNLPKDTLIDRPSWCPIKGVLKDEHGDLIDRNEIEYIGLDMIAFKSDIDELTPIIKAERKDDEQ